MIRRPPRSTLDRSSAASDVYKRQIKNKEVCPFCLNRTKGNSPKRLDGLYEGYGNFWILKCKKGHEWNRLEFEFLNGKQQKIIYQSKLSGYSLITSTTIISGYSLTTPTTINSVSYTHLRAHETVLDLVCRLLLEKKKHTQITDIL